MNYKWKYAFQSDYTNQFSRNAIRNNIHGVPLRRITRTWSHQPQPQRQQSKE